MENENAPSNAALAVIARRLEVMHDGQRALQEKLNRIALAVEAVQALQEEMLEMISDIESGGAVDNG